MLYKIPSGAMYKGEPMFRSLKLWLCYNKKVPNFLGKPKIRDLGPAIVQENIRWLQVSMNNIIFRQIQEPIIDIFNNGISLRLLKDLPQFQMIF